MEGQFLFQRKPVFQTCDVYCFLRSGLGVGKLPFSTGPGSWAQNTGWDKWYLSDITLSVPGPSGGFVTRTLCFQH